MTTPFDAFGPGIVIVTRTDVANSTPVNIGFAQGLSFDFSASAKDLTGQNQFPLDVARGAVKVTAKMTSAVLSGLAWNTVFFGESFATGGLAWAPDEAGTIPSVGPFTSVVTNTATFDQDLGVKFGDSALPLIKVASGATPTTGQYAVSPTGGTYTFAAADAGRPILRTYSYTTTGGQTLAINNHLLGYAPKFQLDYFTSRDNKALIGRYYQCQGTKITLASKLEDFLMPEMDFSVLANSAQQVAKLYFPEVS
jgi:hypothetical protein